MGTIAHIPRQITERYMSDPRDPLVRDPYPQTDATIAAAFEANCTERAAAGIPPLPPPSGLLPSAIYAPSNPTEEQLAVLDATDGIYKLIERYGAPRVMRWVKTMATIAGQEIA